MIVYLASPNTQQQAEHVAGMPVLLSYACYSPWLDSGAFSEFARGKKIDLAAYSDWAQLRRNYLTRSSPCQ